MTRINCNIDVRCLTDEHLLAEHREIKRLPAHYSSFGIPKDIPKEFTLGKGHVLFFIDKPKYTLLRFWDIHAECLKRGFSVTDYSDNWAVYTKEDFNRIYEPGKKEAGILVERISSRITESYLKGYSLHYYGEKLTVNKAIALLTKY